MESNRDALSEAVDKREFGTILSIVYHDYQEIVQKLSIVPEVFVTFESFRPYLLLPFQGGVEEEMMPFVHSVERHELRRYEIEKIQLNVSALDEIVDGFPYPFDLFATLSGRDGATVKSFFESMDYRPALKPLLVEYLIVQRKIDPNLCVRRNNIPLLFSLIEACINIAANAHYRGMVDPSAVQKTDQKHIAQYRHLLTVCLQQHCDFNMRCYAPTFILPKDRGHPVAPDPIVYRTQDGVPFMALLDTRDNRFPCGELLETLIAAGLDVNATFLLNGVKHGFLDMTDHFDSIYDLIFHGCRPATTRASSTVQTKYAELFAIRKQAEELYFAQFTHSESTQKGLLLLPEILQIIMQYDSIRIAQLCNEIFCR